MRMSIPVTGAHRSRRSVVGMPYVRAAEHARLVAAEEVCWTLMLAIGLDILPAWNVEPAVRGFIADPLDAWARHAVATGVMRDGDATDDGDAG